MSNDFWAFFFFACCSLPGTHENRGKRGFQSLATHQTPARSGAIPSHKFLEPILERRSRSVA